MQLVSLFLGFVGALLELLDGFFLLEVPFALFALVLHSIPQSYGRGESPH